MNDPNMFHNDKARRGWWASVVFFVVIIGLVLFLSKSDIVEKNRDILVGIIGMLTGGISSMLAIASGRDPSEIEGLKDKLSSANADREALIARLRDAQIQMQLLRQQVFELQNAVINKLSMFREEPPIKTVSEKDVELPEIVDQWTPKVKGSGNLEKDVENEVGYRAEETPKV